MLCDDIKKILRGEAVPSRTKKQQSIGVKSFYSNIHNGFEYKKLNMSLKKPSAGKAYAYRMLVSFKRSVTYKKLF